MTLYAKVKNLDNGYEDDKDKLKTSRFVLNDRYEVAYIEMSQSHTKVYLVGFKEPFNSVSFEFDENGAPINIYGDPRYNPYI
jgi:hypothetical protein